MSDGIRTPTRDELKSFSGHGNGTEKILAAYCLTLLDREHLTEVTHKGLRDALAIIHTVTLDAAELLLREIRSIDPERAEVAVEFVKMAERLAALNGKPVGPVHYISQMVEDKDVGVPEDDNGAN